MRSPHHGSPGEIATVRRIRSGFTLIELLVMDTDPNAEPRQDDYDVWLGIDTLDNWIKWKRHGDANCLYLDGHVQSTNQAEAYLGMYPGGQLIKTPSFYP